jgi:hypothetical protein
MENMDFRDHQDTAAAAAAEARKVPFHMDSFPDAFEEDIPSERDAWAFLVASFRREDHTFLLDASVAFHKENLLVEEDIHRVNPFLDTSVAVVVDTREIRTVVVVVPCTYSIDYFEKEETDAVESYFLGCCGCKLIFDHFRDSHDSKNIKRSIRNCFGEKRKENISLPIENIPND